LEEDLFPSALSSTTRSDLEEERRLFYVAITRAKRKLTISFAKTRYRWGKLNDCEPSRFINEIDQKYTNFIVSDFSTSFSSKTIKKDNFRFKKPKIKKRLKLLGDNPKSNYNNLNFIDLEKGDVIIHNRFGRGNVISTEGSGPDKKAEVEFETSGNKKILLKFAKYEKK